MSQVFILKKGGSSRRFEEYAYILDYNARGKASTVRGRDGVIITAIGENRLTLLEILGSTESSFDVGEKLYIGKDGRKKVMAVLGKLDYNKISSTAQAELVGIVETIVADNEEKFINYINNARPFTPRLHALELIPGIGKTVLKTLLDEREKKKFESYDDLEDRIGLKDPVKQISKRIIDEFSGDSRVNLFVTK